VGLKTQELDEQVLDGFVYTASSNHQEDDVLPL
jgi:hypothetical protein